MNIWDGIYRTFAEASGVRDAFAEDGTWLEKAVKRTTEGRSSQHENFDVILPVVAALTNRPRILDFGGAIGTGFLPIIASGTARNDIEFHVVEVAALVEAGRRIFADDPRIHFHTDIPAGTFDIVHAGSSLQYVDDWTGMLRTFAARHPKILLFSDVPAGDIETFVTIQNYHGRQIPMRFWNVDEFVRAVESLGFALVYRARYVPNILGKRGPNPMDNFPPSHRLEYPCHLMFRSTRKD